MTTQDIDARAGRAGEAVAENPQQRVRWSVPIALFACVLRTPLYVTNRWIADYVRGLLFHCLTATFTQ
jgi:hypothetical protein